MLKYNHRCDSVLTPGLDCKAPSSSNRPSRPAACSLLLIRPSFSPPKQAPSHPACAPSLSLSLPLSRGDDRAAATAAALHQVRVFVGRFAGDGHPPGMPRPAPSLPALPSEIEHPNPN